MNKQNEDRKLVKECLDFRQCGRISLHTLFDRSLHGVIELLQKIEKHATKAGFTDLSMEVSVGYDNCVDVNVAGKRLETDKEMNERRTRECDHKRRKEQKERQELGRLKIKYEEPTNPPII